MHFKICEYYVDTLISFSSLLSLTQCWIHFMLIIAFSDNYNDIPPLVLIRYGAKVPNLIKKGEFWRLFTANFLHLNIFHLFSNILLQIVFAPIIEKFLGKYNFLGLYLASGIGGFLLSSVYCPTTSVGCSGAIFGLFAIYPAFYILNAKEINRLPYLKFSLLGFIICFIVINLVYSFMYFQVLDHWTHLGGYLTGLFIAFLMIQPCDHTNFTRKIKILSIFVIFIGFVVNLLILFLYV